MLNILIDFLQICDFFFQFASQLLRRLDSYLVDLSQKIFRKTQKIDSLSFILTRNCQSVLLQINFQIFLDAFCDLKVLRNHINYGSLKL